VADEVEGARCLAVQVDITSTESVRTLVQQTLDSFGRIDGLVNNAALDPKFDNESARDNSGAFETYPLELWNQSLAVDLTGMFLCTQAVAPAMLQAGRGVVINVSSIYGLVAPDQSLYERADTSTRSYKPVTYSVTKSAVLGFTRYLAAYWGDKGIRANTLTLGGVFNGHDDEFTTRYNARTPLGRMADKDDALGAMLFLLSDASSYMTGANLRGGWRLDGVVSNNEVLAIVPARGGSKSIPHKNIKLLGGYPLIAYSIAAAQQCPQRDASTRIDRRCGNRAHLARVGRRCAVPAPRRIRAGRHHRFAGFPACAALARRERELHAEIVVQLRPTSPFRRRHHIDDSVELLRERPEADAVRTVCIPFQNPFKMWTIGDDGLMQPLISGYGAEPYNMPRQQLPTVYWQTGYVDVARSATIKGGSMTGRNICRCAFRTRTGSTSIRPPTGRWPNT
jgi:2-deoxy-D-gluconate 3-dehydrogenase